METDNAIEMTDTVLAYNDYFLQQWDLYVYQELMT